MHFFRTRQTMSAGSRSPLGSCLVGQNLPRSPGASTWIGWRRWSGNDSRLHRPLTGRSASSTSKVFTEEKTLKLPCDFEDRLSTALFQGDSGRKVSEGKSRTTSVASKPRSEFTYISKWKLNKTNLRRAGQKLSSGKGSVQFRKSFSFSSDNESLDNISQVSKIKIDILSNVSGWQRKSLSCA